MLNVEGSSAAARSKAPAATGFDTGVFSLLAVVLRGRVFVARVALACGLAAGVISLLRPRTFTSEASFVPQTTTKTPTGLSAIAAQFQVPLPMGDASQSPVFYQRLLRSRATLEGMLDQKIPVTHNGATENRTVLDILSPESGSNAERHDAAIRKLSKSVQVDVDLPIGLVNVRVQAGSGALAQQLLIFLLDALNHFNVAQRRAGARAERDFIEGRVQNASAELTRAEGVLRDFVERNRVVSGSPMLKLEEERLDRDVARQQQLLGGLQQALEQSRFEEIRDTPSLNLVETPHFPISPDPRGVLLKSAIAFILGGLASAFFLVLRAIGIPATVPDAERLEARLLWDETLRDLRRPWRFLKPAARPGASR
jgi:uncharacterized protein involved in exopolysaccharide biosynthesis